MSDDELVDLVDYSGELRVSNVPRSHTKSHKAMLARQGMYLPIVIVVVVDTAGCVAAQIRSPIADEGNNQIDHVCGAIQSGESWQDAARREALEEIGVELSDLLLVDQRVNEYQRYRTLAAARIVGGGPTAADSREASRVMVAEPAAFANLRERGAAFVDGFFSDMHNAIQMLETFSGARV